MWYVKGAVLDAEGRNDESLMAYSRSFRLERIGSKAAIAWGSGLTETGELTKSVIVFDAALVRAASAEESASALAGKGRAFVRLRRYEQAITTLQAALDVRLAEPQNDDPARRDEASVVFEHLGIAYSALNRNSAALNAFTRAWKLTPKNKRNKDKANVVRGISAALLNLDNPSTWLKEWEKLHEELKNDSKLLFNLALALEAIGKRSEAMKHLVKAKRLGLRQAQELLERLDQPTGLNRWTREWLGVQVSTMRRVCGWLLLIVALFGLGAPLYQWLITSKLEWYWLLIPSAAALLLFALPSLRSIKAAGVELSAEPLSATGRDASTPETFNIPTFAMPIAAESKFV
jgi:tetratricopeptide (TPR) repeat protein